MHPSVISASLLMKNKKSPLASLTARLFPPAKPKLFSDRINFTSGYWSLKKD